MTTFDVSSEFTKITRQSTLREGSDISIGCEIGEISGLTKASLQMLYPEPKTYSILRRTEQNE